jgi:predicted metalloprotease with PDZ domain
MTKVLRVVLASAMIGTVLTGGVNAQRNDTIRYDVSFPNASRHEAEITVTYSNLPAQVLELRMSRSSPGRYALHEFGKNVYNVRATDGSGRDLQPTRPNPHQWDVAGHNGTVRVSYTLFGDHADGTYAGIDATHAHLNMPASFMWARNTGDRPIAITFQPPADSAERVRPAGMAGRRRHADDPHRNASSRYG